MKHYYLLTIDHPNDLVIPETVTHFHTFAQSQGCRASVEEIAGVPDTLKRVLLQSQADYFTQELSRMDATAKAAKSKKSDD